MKNQILIGAIIIATAIVVGVYYYSSQQNYLNTQQSYSRCVESCIGTPYKRHYPRESIEYKNIAQCKEECKINK